MTLIDFWFDPISPYSYLAFARLPSALEGLSYSVTYRPILFGALLKHWDHKGPAEIEPKRAWTFRHIAWLSHTLNIALQTPATHPFNPLPLLRLALACAQAGDMPNRRVVEAVMHHVWRGGADPADLERLRVLSEALAPPRDPAGDDVKRELRALTEAAVARGVFGVPTYELDGRLFWGVDALPMLRAALLGDAWFSGPQWDAAALAPPGVTR
jgi:2-hydroxychromene-2-carboxylate isomerase